MKPSLVGLLAALTLVINGMKVMAQLRADTVEAHVAAAKAAAGQEHVFLFNSLCAEPTPATQQRPAPAAQAGPPNRSQWHAEPVKVFDNLYFVGQTEYSAWAVTTSQRIIIIDTIWDYSVADKIARALSQLRL